MGRQVNFYMHPKDEIEFIQRRCNDCKFLLTDHPTPEPEWLHKLPDFPDSGIKGCKILIGKPEQTGPLQGQLIKSQGYYDIDAHDYELVEFSRCGLSGGELSEGRLWFDPLSTFVGTPKSAEFVRWATSLLGWIRRHYSREEIVYGNYVGAHAKEWADQGGRLVGYPIYTRDPG